MAIIIKDNKIQGTVLRQAVQFCTNTPDMGGYDVLVNMDGADIEEVVKHAINAAIIVKRKSVKTRAQAEKLGEGVTFAQMVNAQPKTADELAAQLRVDEMSPEAAKAKLEELQAISINQQFSNRDAPTSVSLWQSTGVSKFCQFL